MAYQVTARKWRPQRFDDVVGQEHITATLKNAIKNNRIAHAFLFTGPRGVGKTTTARILAKALNCENLIDFEPCNDCSMCQSINNSQSIDIIEIDGASNRGIDEIRTLRESVKYAPTHGKYKVYIIDEVHMLTKESFNAFLKTLEEPPAHTIFIFATTDVHKVPLTIISRCQRFDFRRIQLDVIKKQLEKIAKEEKITIDDKTLTIISKKADGALRDAQSLFDQVVSFCGNKIDSDTVAKMLNLIDDEIFFDISDAILTKNFQIVFDVTDKIYQNGWDFIDFSDGLLEHFRNILTVTLSKNSDLIETAEIYKTRYNDYKDSFTKGDLLRILNFLNKLQQELRFSNNQKLKIEIALTNLVGLERSATISELISKIDEIDTVEMNDNRFSAVKENVKTGYPSKIAEPSKRKIDNNDSKEESSHNLNLTSSISSVSGELNLDLVKQKWESYISSVCNDKSFLLKPLFLNTNPVEFDGTNLTIKTPDENTRSSLSLHKDYIDKKSREFFGKKLNVTFETEAEKRTPKTKSKGKQEASSDEILSNSDEFERIIKEKLKGKEISNS